MLKKFYFFILFIFFFSGQEANASQTKESGYQYDVEGYLSKVGSSEDAYSRNFTFYGAVSFYRESTDKSFEPFSAFAVGLNQQIREIPYLGDLNVQFSVFSAQLKERRSIILEITPRISFPEVKTDFPVYTGLGVGLGFYPVLPQKEILFICKWPVFVGLRLHELYHNLGLSTELNLKVHSPFNESTIYLELLGQLGLVLDF